MIPQGMSSNSGHSGAGHNNSGRSPMSHFRSSSDRRTSSDVPEIKIAILGTLGVGKSALVVKYITKRFIMEYDPFLEDVYSKSDSLDGRDVIVKLMDTSDSDEKTADRYLKWANGFIIVFSITCRLSFDDATLYLDAIARYQQESGKEFPVTLVGNKSDLERYRTVSKSTAEGLASQFDCPYLEASAAEDLASVVAVFRSTARDILRSRDHQMSMQSLFISEDRSPLLTGGQFNLPGVGQSGGGGNHSPGGNKRPGNSSKATAKESQKEAKDSADKKDEAKLAHHRRPTTSFRLFNRSFKIFN